MAKKRDRRVGLSSDGRKNQSESPAESSNSSSKSNRTFKTQHLIIIIIVIPVVSIIVYLNFGPQHLAAHGVSRSVVERNGEGRTIHGPRAEITVTSVYERGLVKSDVKYQEIIAEHSRVPENISSRNFQHPVLAYVTPWNSKGYELAKKFNSKLTHISPVWYDLKSSLFYIPAKEPI